MKKILMAMLLVISGVDAVAATGQQCMDKRKQIMDPLDELCKISVEAFQRIINDLEVLGLDAHHYYSVEKRQFVNFYEAIEKAKLVHDETAKKRMEELVPLDCNDSQIEADAKEIVNREAQPLLNLFPKYLHIQLSEITQNGKIFGSDGAVVPQLREGLIKVLHIGGDAAEVVRDPVKKVGEVIGQGLEGIRCGLFGC